MLASVVQARGRSRIAGHRWPAQIFRGNRPASPVRRDLVRLDDHCLPAPVHVSFRGYQEKRKLRLYTYDDLPVPRLPYVEGYAKENAKFNAILATGTLVFTSSVAYFWCTDAFELGAGMPPKSYRNRTIHPVPKTEETDTLGKKLLSSRKDTDRIPVIKSLVAVKSAPMKSGSETHPTPPATSERRSKFATTLLPKHVPYLLVGGGTASAGAARAIIEHEPSAKVLIITDELYHPYRRPPLSKVLWWTVDRSLIEEYRFEIRGRQMDIFVQPEDSYLKPIDLDNKTGVAVAYGRRVVKLDTHAHQAHLDDGSKISYGKCLLATGGQPRPLALYDQLEPTVQSHFSTFRSAADFARLERLSRTARSVVVVGGGLMGSELASALCVHGADRELDVCHVFRTDGLVSNILPPYLSRWSVEYAKRLGIDVRPELNVKDARLDGKKVVLTLDNGAKIKTDHVVMAVGLQPDVSIANASGIPTDPVNGGIKSDTELCCAPDVYCAGDCCSFMDYKSGQKRIEHHSHADLSGEVAGGNMVGVTSAYSYTPAFGSGFGPNVTYTAVGDVNSSLPNVGYFKTDKGVQTVTAVAAGEQQQPIAFEKSKGVVFYLRDSLVVGVLLWNMSGAVAAAKNVINGDGGLNVPEKALKYFNLQSA